MSTPMRYVGGPFDGGIQPDDFVDEIQMRPARSSGYGPGRYVRGEDEAGTPIYRWEPEEDADGRG